jgi:acyl-coenzyme A thioesterase PaaI-like protein
MTFWQRISASLGVHRLLRLIRFYPPYLGAGIRVARADARLRDIEVQMSLSPWNRNYVGTHFGGSLYSMCDPFFMLMVMESLGPTYVVWDKSATIDFVRPGRGRVRARFSLTEEQLAQIREEVGREGRAYPRFETTVLDEAGEIVARVGKVLSVRRREENTQQATGNRQQATGRSEKKTCTTSG